ncbi:MAG: hypothetical protein DI563_22490 [Variovorax paradoxus]|uniref:Uncharacterized protein n=1 Tax=Variovorax paradoxus TaxID=34073 RepID=A0A2W5R8R0_VARPD|nr:MAG: hypothetical protein DI563_22490 [Variovorax paradoxus]
MIITGHLNFFSIAECGLYKHGAHRAAALGPAETFDLIYRWVQGRPMEDTLPWDPDFSKTNASKCYCHDFYKDDDTGEFMFVLWKSDSDAAGTIWGAQAAARTGESAVVEYKDDYKGKKVIWGRPCYYWVLPEQNIIVSVKVDHSVCDSQLLQEWVNKCITLRVPHHHRKKSTTNTGQVRFEFLKDGDLARYAYRFDVKLMSLSTGSAQMQNLAAKVTHIIRRETVKTVGTDDRSKWVKMFDGIPVLPPKPKAKTRQIEVRAEAKPSASEIKEIIEQFAKEDRKKSDWNNVGFATDKGDVWVDRYRLNESLNFHQDAPGVFSAAEMFGRLAAAKSDLFKAIERDKKLVKKTIAGAGA